MSQSRTAALDARRSIDVESPYDMYIYTRQPFFGALGQPQPHSTAKQTYARGPVIRPLTDANFLGPFYDRDKVIVITFWADWCRPCDAVAEVMSSVAEEYRKSAFSDRVKFYHANWDESINPRLFRTFGFKGIPVVFFYYTSTGVPPAKTAPLLEASLGSDKQQFDPREYRKRIDSILWRHGHIPPTQGVIVSQRRGWTSSRTLVDAADFRDIDQMLVEPSHFQHFFVEAYRANTGKRFSKAANVFVASSFETYFQKINGTAPGKDDAGMLDRKTGKIYLRAVNQWLQAYLERAVHEAVHLFTCPVNGQRTDFYVNYGEGIAEGFTQFITEEILKSQKINLVSPGPYRSQLAAAVELVRIVGLDSVSDDYFRCTKNIHTTLERIRQFAEFRRLSSLADRAQNGDRKNEAYDKLTEFLKSISASSK